LTRRRLEKGYKKEELTKIDRIPSSKIELLLMAVMGEGVDLQRFCRHVIHHDLDWSPSQIEQRTGRID